jgi:hypothetical protein
MKTLNDPEVELYEQAQVEAVARFSQALGIPDVHADPETIGGRVFLKFRVVGTLLFTTKRSETLTKASWPAIRFGDCSGFI